MERALSAVAIGLLTATAGLADDWLIGGDDPDEVIILTEDRIVDGDLIIANNAALSVSNGAELTVTGRIVVADQARFSMEQARLFFPQTHSYESEIIAANQAALTLTDVVVRGNGFSHSLGLTGAAHADFTRVEVEDGFATWAFFEEAGATIVDCINTGEFVLFHEGAVAIAGCETVLVWVSLPEGSSIDTTFPAPGAVDAFHLGPDTPWAQGIPYDFTLANCTDVMWAIMARSGSRATVHDSELRVVGSYFERENTIELEGIANSARYADRALAWGDIEYHFLNTSVDTWNFYAAGQTDITLTDCVIGELLVLEEGKGTLSDSICDGSGGYLGVEGSGQMVLFRSTNLSQMTVRGSGQLFVVHGSLMGSPIVADEESQVFFINALHTGPLKVNDSAFLMEGTIEPDHAIVGNSLALQGSARFLLGPESPLVYEGYLLQYGMGHAPTEWHGIGGHHQEPVYRGTLDEWGTLGLDPGPYKLRLSVLNNFGEPLVVESPVNLSPALLVGDLNGDGAVDQADLGLLLASFGIDALGDLDGDDDTDQADLGLLLANYSAD